MTLRTSSGWLSGAASPRFSNVVFLRAIASGTEEAVQYGPAFNSLGVAWQVYHGEDANAVVEVPRDRWMHVRLELDGPVARLFVDTATAPTLVVPRVVASDGAGLALATAPSAAARTSPTSATPPRRDHRPRHPRRPRRRARSSAGSCPMWSRPPTSRATPAARPAPAHRQRAEAEPDGIVLINRYREAPVGGTPRDSTGAVLVDSVMTGRMAGSRIVYARTTVTAARDEIRRMHYAYSDGAVVYLNGRPLAFAMNPSGLRAGLGVMARVGDAVYLPLRRGRNEIVFAVVEATGGWAVSARLDPPGGGR